MVKDRVKKSAFGLTWKGLSEYIKGASDAVESGRICENDEFKSEAVTQVRILGEHIHVLYPYLFHSSVFSHTQ